MDTKKMNCAFRKLATWVKTFDSLIMQDQLMTKCQQIDKTNTGMFLYVYLSSRLLAIPDMLIFTPCHLIAVAMGGVLFLHFLQVNGSVSTRREFKRQQKACKDSNRPFQLSADAVETFVNNHGTAFHMWIMRCLRDRGNEANQQIYYLTSILIFRGTSRRGVDMFSKFSVTLPVRTYDVLRKREILKEEDITM